MSPLLGSSLKSSLSAFSSRDIALKTNTTSLHIVDIALNTEALQLSDLLGVLAKVESNDEIILEPKILPRCLVTTCN
jgi:hypothetical protein